MHSEPTAPPHYRRRSPAPPCSMLYTPQHKHNILTHYCAGQRGAGFGALARRFAVAGGERTIRRWHERWDGTPQSLEARARSGRPPVLSSQEVQQHVRAPLLRANREHRAIHYPKVHAALVQQTGKAVSLQTVRRIGHDELGARMKRGKKRTADERECMHTREGQLWHVLSVWALTEVGSLSVSCQCLPTRASRSPRSDASFSASVLVTFSSSTRL